MQMQVKDMGLNYNILNDQEFLPYRKFLSEKMESLNKQGF